VKVRLVQYVVYIQRYIVYLSHLHIALKTSYAIKQAKSKEWNLRGEVEVCHIEAHRKLFFALRHKRAHLPRQRARAGLWGVVVFKTHIVLVVAVASVIRLGELQITRTVAGKSHRGGVGKGTNGVVLVVIGIHGELEMMKMVKMGEIERLLQWNVRQDLCLPQSRSVPNKNKSFVPRLY